MGVQERRDVVLRSCDRESFSSLCVVPVESVGSSGNLFLGNGSQIAEHVSSDLGLSAERAINGFAYKVRYLDV